ncbi:hypothetical protein TWF481_007622 [Arthrobotrys musiformis]|uniref:Uncharacterized protein n=1 Tax=Arthrobotrys musiformis TaxID=47236 RepID=A0AAV9WD13_9PEZI
MVSIKAAFPLILVVLGAVAAVPTPNPELDIDYVNALIPGEDLPSPKELGLTNEDLMKPIPNGISKRGYIFEGRYECKYAAVCTTADSRACFNYLFELGQKNCRVTGKPTELCRIRRCRWIGQAEVVPVISSSYRDIAYSGNTVTNRCELGGLVGGFNYPSENSPFRVTVVGDWNV